MLYWKFSQVVIGVNTVAREEGIGTRKLDGKTVDVPFLKRAPDLSVREEVWN
jgi:hypothetical protein